jgi:hypothetical protein
LNNCIYYSIIKENKEIIIINRKYKRGVFMDGIACALNKNCRREKSQEIVKNMNDEQNVYEEIYADNLKEDK